MSDYKFTYLKSALFAGFLILLNTTNIYAATPACGTALTADTTLDSNMNCSSTALYLQDAGSNNVTVDCAGFTITVTGFSSPAIWATNVTGVIIKNCNINTNATSGFGIGGILISNSEISNNIITTANTHSLGIILHASSNNLIDGNTISTTGLNSRPIQIENHSSSNIVSNNNVISAESDGVRIRASSDNNILSNNTIASDVSNAVRIESSAGNQLTDNTFISPSSFVLVRKLAIQDGGLSVDNAGNVFAVENNFGGSGGAGGSVTTMIQVDPNTGDPISYLQLESGGDDLGFGFDSLEIMSDGRFLATRGGNNTSLYEINSVSGEVTLIPITYPALNGNLNGLQATDATGAATGADILLATTNDGELLSIDLRTNMATVIAQDSEGSDGEGWTDLALHPTTGRLYVSTRWSVEPSGTSHLWEINPADGNIIREIGDTGVPFLSDIDFSAGGVLYGNNNLVMIDETSGLGTTIGGFGSDPNEAPSANNRLTNQTFTVTTMGSVQFLQPLDLPSQDFNLDSTAIQLGQNLIFVDSALFPFLDVPARITFEGLGGTERDLLIDPQDDGTFEPCDPPQCTLVSFADGTLIFDVTGFSTYSSEEVNESSTLESVVLEVLAKIDALLNDPGVTDKAKKELNKSKKKLAKALRELGKGKIEKSLSEISKAVKQLLKAEKKGADVAGLIDLLVESSRAEAQDVIDSAIAMGGKPKHIDKAQAELVKAQKELDKGKPDKAIGFYKKALKSGNKAVKGGDVTPPDTSISSSPVEPTGSTSAFFEFISTEMFSTFQCSIDNSVFSICTSPANYVGLIEGSHSFMVRATDVAGNVDSTPASYDWQIEPTPPDTFISSGPASVTGETDASFVFASTVENSTFQCSLDGSEFVNCTSPVNFTGLAGGNHSLRVRATDAAGNADPTPATSNWDIDVIAPDTNIFSGPVDPTKSTSASFSFTSTEVGSTFQCSLDGGAFTACSSPIDYTGLTEGNHTFSVVATDLAGNTDATTATYNWDIDVIAPDTNIFSGPVDLTKSTSASFSFTSTEVGSTFQCSLDGGAFSVCTSPNDYIGLTEGNHIFSVVATDLAGNTDATTATYSWDINFTVSEIDRLETNMHPNGIKLVGNLAYVADEYVGLHIVDITNSMNPAIIGSLKTVGTAVRVAVNGQYTYLVENLGNNGALRIIDTLVSGNPILLNSVNISANIRDVEISGDLLFVAIGNYFGPWKLVIFDISNPVAITELVRHTLAGRPLDIEIESGYAYIVESEIGLRTVDISNPSVPQDVGVFSIDIGFRGDVEIDGNIAYVTNENSGALILDISSPASPSAIGEITTSDNVADIEVIGNQVLIADSQRGVAIYDVSDPLIPVVQDTLDTGAAFEIEVAGGVLYVADAGSGFRVIDISTPSNILDIGNIDQISSFPVLDINNNFAYIGDSNLGLRIIDISDSANLFEVGRHSFGSPVPQRSTINPRDIDVVGTTVYFVTTSSTRIVDVSNPFAPTEIGIINSGFSEDIEIVGDVGFIGQRAILKAYDILNPALVSEIGSLVVPEKIRAIEADGNILYVASGEEVLVIDVTIANLPLLIGSFNPGTLVSVEDIKVVGNTVYAWSFDGLYAIDVTSPTNPVEISHLESIRAFSLGKISIDGDKLYASDGNVKVIDISDPANMILLQDSPYLTQSWDVESRNNLIYIADEESGLRVLQ